jgi:hypothetical protein
VAGILDQHRDAARIVLAAITEVRGNPTAEAPYGLAGGNALIAHRLSRRLTMDVDIAISEMRGDWKAIEAAIETALAASGYTIERVEKTADLDIFADLDPDTGYPEEIGLSEWVVRAPGSEEDVQVQVSNFDLKAAPVFMPGIGPVLALVDVAGWKTVAFGGGRHLARDVADMAELLTRYTARQLIKLARERDPGLRDDDLTEAGRYVDQVRDDALAAVLRGTGRDVGWVRRQLNAWPR